MEGRPFLRYTLRPAAPCQCRALMEIPWDDRVASAGWNVPVASSASRWVVRDAQDEVGWPRVAPGLVPGATGVGARSNSGWCCWPAAPDTRAGATNAGACEEAGRRAPVPPMSPRPF